MRRDIIDKIEDLVSRDSEAGIIATLVRHPEFIFYSENLLPNHFTLKENKIVYQAIGELARRSIATVDPYNIIEVLSSQESTRRYADELSVEKLYEMIEESASIARSTTEEYRMLVDTVMELAFRRDMYNRLKNCAALCLRRSETEIEQKIYREIDSVTTEYMTTDDMPVFSEVVDDCWNEIRSRQGDGYAGIPFKFERLNEYVTIEKGELVVFAGEAKQGKSMMLLNCAVDLLRRDKAVLYIDSELNTRLFTARIIAHLTGIEYKRLTSGNYSGAEEERIDEAIRWLKTRKFVHTYIPLFDQQTIYTTVKKMSHTTGLDVLIVDYFKSSADGDAWDSYAELGRYTDLVKNRICGDMGVCGIGAVQATSTGKVADSAKIGRNASTVILIQDKTPEEMEADGPECGNKKLRVILNRNGAQMAPGEYLDMVFDGNHVLYEEAKQHVPKEPF